MFESAPPDMQASHHGVAPWWMVPAWVPVLPPNWDIVGQFRELLRYSVAGAFQGAILVAVTLAALAFGLPIRGLSLLLFFIGMPIWFGSAAYLVPRRSRRLLREYARKYPDLYDWFRQALAREDARVARTMLLLHAAVLGVSFGCALLLWAEPAFRVWVLVTLAGTIGWTTLFVLVLVLRWNSAGVSRANPS